MPPPPPPGPPSTRWRLFSRDLAAALVVGLAAAAFYISSASLMFQSAALAPHLPVAIAMIFLGGAVLSILSAARGSLPLASTGAEPSSIPVLAAITGGIATQATPAAALPTAVAALALTALLIGLLWSLLGLRGWGNLIRYIPYPVVGGFIGAVGWLLVVGGAGVSTGTAFVLLDAPAWLAAHADARLASGFAIGIGLWWGMQRFKHPLTLPALLVASGLAVHAGLVLAGLDLPAAREHGWVLSAFPTATPLWPGSPALLAAVEWPVLLQQAGLIFSAVVVTTISLPLSDSSLEVAWDERADVNRDLRVLGAANVLAGALGGLSGGISISRSVLNRAAGAATRASGLMQAALCVLMLLWGGPVVALLPRPLLGGLLVYLGLGMLKTWLIDARRLERADYATIVAMVAVTATLGFLPAVCLGVVACCVAFVATSSRLPPLRRTLLRKAWPDRVERGAFRSERLQAAATRLRIVELQGFLFFGSATQLADRVEPLLDDEPAPSRILFDFRHVHGIDSSAAQVLARLYKLLRRRGVAVALSGLAVGCRQALDGAAALTPDDAVYEDIEAAVEAWDGDILAQDGPQTADVDALLQQVAGSADAARALLARLTPLRLAAGATLFSQGDPSDALYFVRSGSLSTHVNQGGQEVRVRLTLAGGVIGEMGLLRELPRTATVRAAGDAELLRLSLDDWAALRREAPALASALLRWFVVQQAARIEQLTAQAHELAR